MPITVFAAQLRPHAGQLGGSSLTSFTTTTFPWPSRSTRYYGAPVASAGSRIRPVRDDPMRPGDCYLAVGTILAEKGTSMPHSTQ